GPGKVGGALPQALRTGSIAREESAARVLQTGRYEAGAGGGSSRAEARLFALLREGGRIRSHGGDGKARKAGCEGGGGGRKRYVAVPRPLQLARGSDCGLATWGVQTAISRSHYRRDQR